MPLSEAARALLDARLPYLRFLDEKDRVELEGHVQVFLDEKYFSGCGGLEIDDEIRLVIAAQACVLLLRRGVDAVYPGLVTVVVYPHAYVTDAKRVVGGIVLEGKEVRLGESWDRGTLVLSWDDVLKGAVDVHDGHNVVFHEFAHQLDQQAGGGTGTPALGSQSRHLAWARVLGNDYRDLVEQVQKQHRDVIDAYGATNPAEFFAVVTECFFEKPGALKAKHPALYDRLRDFYRRDPAAIAAGRPEELPG